MAKATLDQVVHIGGMFASGEYDREMAQAIIDKRIVIKPGSPYRGVPAAEAYCAYESKVEGKLPPHHFRITVEKTEAPSFTDLKSAYDWVSDLWDESKYALKLHESLAEIVPTAGDKVVFLKKFDRDTSSEKAIKWADEHNYRLAFPCEREAFAKANPDLQRKFWIVDLGSSVVRDGSRYVPVLGVSGGERSLDDYWFDDEWGASDRFLFVSK